ncbi:MAG: hypothetical protein KTR14_03810 [Vampirovibrio sp.]|nr:hypothetical protein [Vampirovibrio sp.]
MADNNDNPRFYEKDPIVFQAVEALFCFPHDFQSIISEGLAEIAERECKASELQKEFKSVGYEKVMALHKSKRKGRPYDHNPQTHKMMNYLMLLSDDHRRLMARETLQLLAHIQEYLSMCKEYQSDTSERTIRTLTGTYVAYGSKATQDLLQNVKKQLLQTWASRNQKITGRDEGMAVSGE